MRANSKICHQTFHSHLAPTPHSRPQAKIANPKTKRPATLVWSNEDYTNPKYAGTIWWIADHLKNPANPIVPLSSTPHHESQLDADFFDAISDALDYCDKRVADRTRFGHRNMADHNLDSVLSANWAGAFLHHKEIDKQVTAEQATGWVDDSMYTPSTWPFVVDPQGCVVQGVKEDGSPKARRTTDKWVTNDAIAQLPAVSLCTNIAIGKAGAIMEAGCSGPCAIPNADENPEDPATIADDDRTYLFKLDLTAAYRQVMVYLMCLYMCHTMWRDKINLDRRGQFGDASMVEGFQAITMLVLAAGRAAIRGHKGIRALLPELTHVWQWVDALPTNEDFEEWRATRVDAGLDEEELRLAYIDGYIDDYLGTARGRRRAYACSAIFRTILRRCGFEMKVSKECLPARVMTTLGGDLDLNRLLAQLSEERAKKYSDEALAVAKLSRYPVGNFRSLMGRLVSAAIYEPAGRSWLVAGFMALRQALRREREHVFLGPGVKKELAFWVAMIEAAVGIPLFPATDFPPPETPLHRVDWFDASTSWGMGGAALVRVDEVIVAFFFTWEWTDAQKKWHVNVMESVAGQTILEAADAVAPSPFQTGRGDNTTANAGHRKNATRNLQIAAVLRRRADFVVQRRISTRPVYVNTKKNVIGDPLSRGPQYFPDFRRAARQMGATKFVRLDIPQTIFTLMREVESLFPEQEQQEQDSREFHEERRPATPLSPASPAPPTHARLADIGVTRDAWTYAVTFCGLDTFMLAARRHGGSPALACDNHGPAQAFWQRRTKRQCLASLDIFRKVAKSPEGRQLLIAALVYTSGPPCIDFSRAGCGRGTDGRTGHLFLEDAEAALEADLPVVISEIVLGILTEALIHFLRQKVARLRTKYRTEWRIFRCNRNGDLRTNRRRVIIVGVKPKFLRENVTSLLPSERPPALPVGLGDILEPESDIPSDLMFTQLERIVQAPARADSGEVYDGLRLLARVDGSDRIGHQIYSADMAATIRTDGDGPGGATGLYLIGDVIRRLTVREAARTHSIDETTTDEMFRFLSENPFLDAEKESFRFVGNSIPVMTLDAVLSHILSILRW